MILRSDDVVLEKLISHKLIGSSIRRICNGEPGMEKNYTRVSMNFTHCTDMVGCFALQP